MKPAPLLCQTFAEFDKMFPVPRKLDGETEAEFDARWRQWTGERIDAVTQHPANIAENARRLAALRDQAEARKALAMSAIRDDELDSQSIRETAHSRRWLHPAYENYEGGF